MFNIRIMGKLNNEKELINRELPLNAKAFDEGDSLQDAFTRGFLVSLPFVLIVIISSVSRLNTIVENTAMDMNLFIISFIITMVLSIGLKYLHEMIHALCYPLSGVKEIWNYKKHGAYLVYCEANVSKKRFIWINLAPNIMLGFIPFAIWLFIAELLPLPVMVSSMFLLWYMIVGGIVDYFNVYNTIKQVPKGAHVFNYGLHSYWTGKE